MMPTVPPVKARTSAVFVRSFRIPGFDEELPPGEYLIETELHRKRCSGHTEEASR